ncbi:hypothetical protein FSARC_8809 [Fusarium sarcochroum]|uniref:Major facilitator superfamily (MFS) profile domain-containing protein n=1 Tax=Fusarium sarcochroum TaxID=1208366 RepID=A0A8H4TS59_9HYPO|nr:hypothetical protein FSARC_8809 [Fusarium sarcochroum]
MFSAETTSRTGDMESVKQAEDVSAASPEANNTADLSNSPTKLSKLRKAHILLTGFCCCFNSSLGTSIPSGASAAISKHFNVHSKSQLTLLNSLNMAGFVLGPLFFGPLSEYIGRRPVIMASFIGYIVFTLACSLAPSYPALLAFRLLTGINAAAPVTVASGLFADILGDPSQRGVAIALYMAVNTIGALCGPLVSGFTSQISWRWAFWAASLIAAPTLPLVLFLPETFAPVLAIKEAQRQAKYGEQSCQTTAINLKPFNARKIFLRPVTLMAREPKLLFSSLYLTLAYGTIYLFFQAYPIIFQDFYGLSPGIAGLAYLPIALGAVFALGGFCLYTRWYDRSAKTSKPWAQRETYRRLPLACLASPCMVISLFWLGWTSQTSVSPVIPALGGFLFGVGFQLIFMSMLNYITDAFCQFAASAHAGAGCLRSLGAIFVPLAASPMYAQLGIHWAPSVLGFLALAMGMIPFIFIWRENKLTNAMRTPQTPET